MWQTFRTAYSESVIFGKKGIEESFNAAATEVKTQIGGD
jgi:hypothetical protein